MTISYAWSTSFTQPAAPTGLAVTPDTGAIALDISWTASPDAYHFEELIEAQVGDGDWTEIGRTTGPAFTYYLAPLNRDVRMRVSDSNGSQYSVTTEAVGSLTFPLWALTHTAGNEDFIAPLQWAQEGASIDLTLDQTVLQPLSGPDGDTQLPIVITGQWQGERVALAVIVPSDDQAVLEMLKRAVRQPSGTIAIKSPDGEVYIIQFGPIRLTKQDGFTLVALSAIRVG